MHLVLNDGEVWDSPRVLGSFKNSEDRYIACPVPIPVIAISPKPCDASKCLIWPSSCLLGGFQCANM